MGKPGKEDESVKKMKTCLKEIPDVATAKLKSCLQKMAETDRYAQAMSMLFFLKAKLF